MRRNLTFFLSSLMLIVFMTPEPLYAAQPGSIDFFLTGVKLFAGTAIVVGIMFLVHYLNRRGMKFFEGRNAGSIRIVEMRPVGGRKSLCLVEVRGETILLGLGNERIDLLHHFGSPSAADSRFENELREQGRGTK